MSPENVVGNFRVKKILIFGGGLFPLQSSRSGHRGQAQCLSLGTLGRCTVAAAVVHVFYFLQLIILRSWSKQFKLSAKKTKFK